MVEELVMLLIMRQPIALSHIQRQIITQLSDVANFKK